MRKFHSIFRADGQVSANFFKVSSLPLVTCHRPVHSNLVRVTCVGAELAAVRLGGTFVDVRTGESVGVELVSAAASAGGRCVGHDHTRVLTPAASVAFLLHGAVHFVLAAGTILFAVADVLEADARVVGAGELILAAPGRTVAFIFSFLAVGFSVADPGQGHAALHRRARHVRRPARRRRLDVAVFLEKHNISAVECIHRLVDVAHV